MLNSRILAEKNNTENKQVIIIQCAEDIGESLDLLGSYRVIQSVAVLGIMVLSSSGAF